MSASPIDRIASETLPGDGRVIVAFSGGPDSVCLLHQLVTGNLEREIACVHVDHGLDAESAQRAQRAVELAARLHSDCEVVRVEVQSGGDGPEAQARSARYRALEARMNTGDVLATAHHADDQAETVLLRILRGAGPEGLAGIRPIRRFGPGWLARPLLDWERSAIEAWLERHDLACIRDPANDNPDFDRNHLRHEVLPGLRQRWPGVDAGLRRSARLCLGAAEFVARHIAADLDAAIRADGTLAPARLSDEGDYYRAEAIRAWCIRQHVEPPPARRLDTFVRQLRTAGHDRCPELRWSDRILRYWDRRLWLEPAEATMSDWAMDWDGSAPLHLPAGLGSLRLKGPAGPPLKLEARSGKAGDALRPAGDAHHRDCSRLLAEARVPPWQRDHWPRLWLEGRLVGLGARWRTAGFERLLEARGQSLVWQPGARSLAGAGLESPS